jgi:hypothetical protein
MQETRLPVCTENVVRFDLLVESLNVGRGGRLIRRMSVENLLWGEPRFHGELMCTENAIRLDPGSRKRIGRPRISAELRNLIGATSRANHLWAHHTLAVNCSSPVSRSRSRRSHAICTGVGRHRRAGGTTAPDREEAMLVVKKNARQILRSNFASTRNLRAGSTSLVLSLAVAVCMMVWPPPLVAADADACKTFVDKLAVDKDGKITRSAFDQLMKEPSPFHAALGSQRLPGGRVAWVTFQDKRFTDANVEKVCVRAFYDATGDNPQPVSIRQVFVSEKEHLKVVFDVPPSDRPFYSRADFLFVGVLADTTPSYFNYFVRATVTNGGTAVILSLLFVSVAYLFLVWITYEPADVGDLTGVDWLAYTLSPIRITAGWFGDASMSQVQIILFTFIVAGLLFHVWLSTAALSNISTDLLILLGISAAGAGTAKFAQTLKISLKPETARFLIGKGWFDWKLSLAGTHATLRNLLLTDGRLDVYKFQMAIFTVVVAFYVISAGQTDLGEVKISETMLYLIGISQGVYVGGKAVTDRTTDLENAVAKMMELENKIVAETDEAKRKPLLAEYERAASFAIREFAPLYNREVPKDSRAPAGSDTIDPAVLRPAGL